ncbi:hypothetical protein GCM10011405_40760 [Rufibacter glacialis]|nr:hypothetical protein GCM10011405_40760 [Rufibacter glacialis]
MPQKAKQKLLQDRNGRYPKNIVLALRIAWHLAAIFQKRQQKQRFVTWVDHGLPAADDNEGKREIEPKGEGVNA